MSLIKTDEAIRLEVIDRLKHVFDPEIPVNIYDLGLIYEIEFAIINNYRHCTVEMTLTSPACPVAESLVEQVRYVSLSVAEVDEVNVNVVFDPPWGTHLMSEEAKEVMALSGAII